MKLTNVAYPFGREKCFLSDALKLLSDLGGCEANEVGDHPIAMCANLVWRVACCEADGENPGSHAGCKAGEGIFENDAIVGREIENACAKEEAIGIGLGSSEILAGEDAVEECVEFGTLLGNPLHLRPVRTGHDGAADALCLDLVYEFERAGNPVVMHPAFLLNEFGCDDFLKFWIGEVLIKNLNQCRTFDQIFQTRDVRTVLAADIAPNFGVLTFGIEQGAVEVEKRCLKIFHGAKIVIFGQ